ncbi:MAG TPA: DUF309 domain-containing protein [Holophagaceae bacterium]|nr:DUF309 domain-containing protein [Holophagaceae bacterium]
MSGCGNGHIETPFWQRQPVLPLEVQRFLRARLEAALEDPGHRADLAWPTVLGAPRLRQLHPEGLPETELFNHAARMLRAVGIEDPAAAWAAHLPAHPDTAEAGATGWRPAAAWGAFGPLVSLRCGWQLAALSPLPTGERYLFSAGVSLFNHGLFHECHDALEPLWLEAVGPLKQGLQGLILLTAGYHHLQLHNTAGMLAVWEEALAKLPEDGHLATPWGPLDASLAVTVTRTRLERVQDEGADLGPLWALDRPFWTLEL